MIQKAPIEECLTFLSDYMRRPRASGKSLALSISEYLYEFKALKSKIEKYRWHDLSKNPNDLPVRDRRIFFYTVAYPMDSCEKRLYSGEFFAGVFINDDKEGWVTRNTYNIKDVLFWRYADYPEKEVESCCQEEH